MNKKKKDQTGMADYYHMQRRYYLGKGMTQEEAMRSALRDVADKYK